ncbi:hypothetical protein GCK72_024242 [Caenorhabditis remanei]|uniref:Uncharacterized protein n=1 Tax=Caenorhabditis remanei TaxID=31234 RepID=A0A6A5FYQ8_CAERE|nr:hypothetical protein GCK72_024242 [Caenorhabditis remanei]KAF1747776.1 hypothetical protein GCK72_024242 [Caenorhabditis remanei]
MIFSKSTAVAYLMLVVGVAAFDHDANPPAFDEPLNLKPPSDFDSWKLKPDNETTTITPQSRLTNFEIICCFLTFAFIVFLFVLACHWNEYIIKKRIIRSRHRRLAYLAQLEKAKAVPAPKVEDV